jgi:hypothetical protein
MRTIIDYSATISAASAVAVALAGAPSALAAPTDQACSDMGGATQCQSTASAEIYAAPRDIPVTPRTAYGPFEGYHAGHI